MAENKHDLDTPAGYVGNIKPDGAEKMPTKTYHNANLAGDKGKMKIDGPCEGKESYHK